MSIFILPLVGAVIGTLVALWAITLDGAPQQAAGFAMALCWGALPYVFARAIEKLLRPAGTCDVCRERMDTRALRCPHCGSENPRGMPTKAALAEAKKRPPSERRAS